MEGDQNQSVTPQETVSNPNGNVSFPTVGQPQKGSGAKTLLIVGILILVGILGFVIYKSASKKSETVSEEPTPIENLTQPVDNGISNSPTPSASPSVSKSKVAIQIQNGTGITGEAAYLQTQLGAIGYTNIKVGNAVSQSLTTTQVTFSNNLDSSVVSEITTKLNSLYQNVTTSTSASQTFDVVIVTGLRKGATPKPSATATPTSTPSASPTPTATP